MLPGASSNKKNSWMIKHLFQINNKKQLQELAKSAKEVLYGKDYKL